MLNAHNLATDLEEILEDFEDEVEVVALNPYLVRINFDHADRAPSNIVEEAVANAGWMATWDHTDGESLSIAAEPMEQPPHAYPGNLLHATRSKNLSSIREHGILPQRASLTWRTRIYPTPRSFFVRSLRDALTYIADTTLGTVHKGELPELSADQLADWEILLIDLVPYYFYRDPMVDSAYWTDETIPPAAISRVMNWQDEYTLLTTDRRISLVGL